MGQRLVNSFPGMLPGAMVPGDRAHFGLKSESGSVNFSSLNLKMGMTGIVLGTVVPEEDEALKTRGAKAILSTTERRQPPVGAVSRTLSSGALQILKTDNADNNLCVYEISYPAPRTNSALGYIKLRKSSWTLFSPDWINKTQMAGVYLGLEHGGRNSALYVFLRDDGAGGSLVVGGPLGAYGGARPGQAELSAIQWAALPDDTAIEIWIYFNLVGYSTPYVPAFEPVVELWTKRDGVDTVPVLQSVIPVSDLGIFPKATFDNFRPGASDVVRLYIGNAGKNSDLLTIDDFALFPDYRFAVRDGVPLPGSLLWVRPDAPVSYRSSERLLPRELYVGRWGIEGAAPGDALEYFSNEKKAVRCMSITKNGPGRSAYMKKEPRLEAVAPVSSQDGCMIEALIDGHPQALDGELFGAGFSLDDGVKLYQIGMLSGNGRTTYGLLRNLSQQTSVGGYHLPDDDVDFRAARLLQLIVDRRRNEVALLDEGAKVLSLPLSSSAFPASEGNGGKARFGHVFDSISTGRVNIGAVNYLPRYLAYEASDGDLPPVAGTTLTSETANDSDGSSSMENSFLLIDKRSFGTPGSKRLFTKSQGFAENGGLLVDFSVGVRTFTDSVGQLFAPMTMSGAGVIAYLGTKKIVLTFGLSNAGPVIAVLPGSGTQDDILKQTQLGRAFSAKVAFLTPHSRYRLVMRSGAAIEVWAGSQRDEPLISIPWRNEVQGFDLPIDTHAPALSFGHFDEMTASRTEWSYVRWGSSNGFEISVAPKFDELAPYLFGGRVLVSAEFDD